MEIDLSVAVSKVIIFSDEVIESAVSIADCIIDERIP